MCWGNEPTCSHFVFIHDCSLLEFTTGKKHHKYRSLPAELWFNDRQTLSIKQTGGTFSQQRIRCIWYTYLSFQLLQQHRSYHTSACRLHFTKRSTERPTAQFVAPLHWPSIPGLFIGNGWPAPSRIAHDRSHWGQTFCFREFLVCFQLSGLSFSFLFADWKYDILLTFVAGILTLNVSDYLC